MKRKILSISLALVLLCSFSLVTAVPAAAGTTADYNAAVIKAADRLAATQNDDGGFDWYLDTDPASTSYTNILGISAMGILKAYELEDKAIYETALAKAYKYAVDTPPTWGFTAGEWKEDPKGVDSWPDVTFLVWLAEAAGEDASLLEAIQTLKSGTTASGIADLARTLWDDRVDYMGDRATEIDPSGTATAMAEYFRDIRGYPDCIPWDLEAAVKAALALDVYYSGQGYDLQAAEIAEVIYDSLYGVTTYFDITEPAQEGYIHGVTGALEAFVEVSLHSDKVLELKAILLTHQHDDGYWNWHDPDPGLVVESVQDTAYAIMALVRQGDADAVIAVRKGADWLVSSQLTAGGWYGEGGIAPELPEVDSEAVWALATMPALELEKDWYKTGDVVNVTVEDAVANDPLRKDTVVVTVKSTTDTYGTTATLTETGIDTGIFEGSFLLVPPPVPAEPNPGELVVVDGDLITVTYLGVTDTARVDDIPPEISNVSPIHGAIVPSATPLISATLADVGSGIDIATGKMTIDGTGVGVTTSSSSISHTLVGPLVDGEHTVTVNVYDYAGNPAEQVSWSFTVDTGLPGVTEVQLIPDQPYTAVGTITFTLTFNEDMDTGVAPEVTFGLTSPYDLHSVNGDWIGGSQVGWVGEFVIVAPWTQDGEHTLSVSGAQDLAGNVMVSDTSTAFVIDLNAPFVPFHAQMHVNQNPPGTADSVYGDDYAVESNAFVEVWNDASARDPEINLIGSIDANSNGAFGLIDIGDNKNGEVWVTAMDAYGHRSDATKLLNDIVGPEIWSGTWSVGGVKPPWILEGQVIDVTITGESGCTGTFDIGAIATGVSTTETSGIYTGSYTVAAGNDVENAPMKYRLTDAAGNFSTLGEVKGISIDTIAPTIDTLTPADGTYVDTATPEISAVLDDNLSGVDQASIVMTVDGAGVTPVYADGIVSYTPASGLGEGVHTVTLDVSDVAGNPATQASWSFTVDTIDPIITMDLVTTPTDVESQEIKGTFAEVNLYKITLAYNGWDQLVNTSGPNWAVPTFVHLNEGDNLIVATITDLAGNSAFAEATVNLDTQAPVVTLTSPNGGESLLGGNMYNITWTASDANFITNPIAIEYSIDGGSSWNDVAMAEPNDGGYLWAVPKLDSSDCQVRVTGADSLGKSSSDVSDAVFTITTRAPDAIAPAVTVNSPNGGEIWQGGSPRTITWTATDDKTPSASLLVDLYYSSDGGTVWTSIASIAANNGSYSWSVPGINSSQCLVKVEARDTSGNVGFDISNTVFTIGTPGAPVTTIALKTGWNLISLPLIPTDGSIDVVLADISDDVSQVRTWVYEAGVLTEKVWINDGPAGFTQMAAGQGYWIEMTEENVLIATGVELPAPPQAPPSYSVYEGWNLIGFKSLSVDTLAKVYLGQAVMQTFERMYGYNAAAGLYTVIRPDEDKLQPGQGYWLAVSADGTIYP